ncbi:hypothetical protein HK405_015996, partial [Cladochytrium tenue]
ATTGGSTGDVSAPPLLVVGETGTCIAAILGRTLARLELRATTARGGSRGSLRPGSEPSPGHGGGQALLVPGAASGSSVSQRPVSRRPSTAGTGSEAASVVEPPVVVARVVGLTARSDDARSLMLSVAAEVRAAFGTFGGGRVDMAAAPIDAAAELHAALGLARRNRPVFVLLACADRLTRDGGARLGWLLQDGLPAHVSVVVGAVDGGTAATAVMAAAMRAAPAHLAARVRATGSEVPPSAGEVEAVVAACRLEVGAVIGPVVRGSVRAWLAADGRRLTAEQQEAVVAAFEGAEHSAGGGSGGPGFVPPRMVRLLYARTRRWTRADFRPGDGTWPKTVEQAMAMMLFDIEEEVGRGLARMVLAGIAVSRFGLTFSEMIDLLKLGAGGTGLVTQGHRPSLLAQLVQMVYVVRDHIVKSPAWGGDVHTFRGDDEFSQAVRARYLSESGSEARLRRLLVEVFSAAVTRDIAIGNGEGDES